MSSKIYLVEKGCLICGGDVKGNRKAQYYCAKCNVLFSHQSLERYGHIKKKMEPKFVGSRNSNKIHKLDCMCAKRISKKNRVFFVDEDSARKLKYKRCGVCF